MNVYETIGLCYVVLAVAAFTASIGLLVIRGVDRLMSDAKRGREEISKDVVFAERASIDGDSALGKLVNDIRIGRSR